MVAIKNILFFATAITALTIGKRDTATILSDIAAISSNNQALTTAANNYNGGVFNAIPILTASNSLGAAIDQGTASAKATAAQSSADSLSVVAAIDALIPTINAGMSAIVAKKALFVADGISGTVRSTIVSLKAKTDLLSAALIAIASADTQAAGAAQKATIDSAFDAAIAAFN